MAVVKTAHTIYLSNVMGTVEEIYPPNKTVVTFNFKGEKERALLLKNKLFIDGKPLPEQKMLYEVVHQGSLVKFTCHTFSDTGENRCKWYITNAWRQHKIDMGSPIGNSVVSVIFGLHNVIGSVVQVEPRHCIVCYTDMHGTDENVLVLASKVYIKGHRASSKQSLRELLHVDDTVMFDATPCEPEENSSGCKWFATLMWLGHRPSSDCDNPIAFPAHLVGGNLLGYIKQITSNSKSAFIHGTGRVVNVVNEEYGIALISLWCNQWQSLLFHRSVCFLFGLNLSAYDLRKVFKEGDQIKFFAVPAPDGRLITKWLATQMSVNVGSQFSELELSSKEENQK